MGRVFDSMRHRLPRLGRRTRWSLAILAGAVAIGVLLSYLGDEPLRRSVEGQMNARLTGYRVGVGALRLHPLRLSLTLFDLTFTQEANPDPPVGRIPRLHARVHWRALLSGRLVANFAVDRPRLYVNLAHLRAEAADSQPVSERGWQDAFQAIYPLKINRVTIANGDATYVDDGPFEPLELSAINFVADNIRNIASRERDYPSAFHLDAVVFKQGTVTADGHADFLAEPHVGIKAGVALDRIELDYFKPLTRRYDVAVSHGVLSASGLVEYAPTIKVVDLEQALIRGVHVEYTHTPAKKGVVQAATAKTVEAAREASNDPGLLLRAKEMRVTESTVGFVNKAVDPPYRVFMSHVNLTLSSFSNRLADGTMVAVLTGKFMGSGDGAVTARFRPETKGPDFDVNLSLENTDLRALNDVLRAHGKFDVAAGTFSLFSEIAVKNNRVEGYVKPLFSNVDVYDPVQDRDKSLGRKLYEKVVEGVAKVLKNAPRKEVATVASISGPVENVKAHSVEVVLKLLQNAFFKAILPGFDAQVPAAGRRTK